MNQSIVYGGGQIEKMKISANFTSDSPDVRGIMIDRETEKELGLKYVPTSFHYYEVIDERLFFLSVLKYGIRYERIK